MGTRLLHSAAFVGDIAVRTARGGQLGLGAADMAAPGTANSLRRCVRDTR